MKIFKSILIVFILGVFSHAPSYAQNQVVLHPDEVPEVTHVNLADFPKGKPKRIIPMAEAAASPAGARGVMFLPHMSAAGCPVVDARSLRTAG